MPDRIFGRPRPRFRLSSQVGLRRRLPGALFILSICALAFAWGLAAERWRIFPYDQARIAYQNARLMAGALSGRHSDYLTATADRRRLIAMAGAGQAPDRPVVVSGGPRQFQEICPPDGCLAVAYAADGGVAAVWPYRPDALEQAMEDAIAAATGEYPYERRPWFRFRRDIVVDSFSVYPDGDLLVALAYENGAAFPYGAGVVRVDRDGWPVWFRADYSHHHPSPVMDDGSVLVPSMRLGAGDLRYEVAAGRPATVDCPTDRPMLDAVNLIGPDGTLLRSWDLVEAFIDSPYAGHMQQADDPCYPLHLNFAMRLPGEPGESDRLLVSLRGVSAYALLDWDTGRLLEARRGSFYRQHGVAPAGDGKRLLLLDNEWARESGAGPGASRVLSIDLNTGLPTTLYPRPDTPAAWRPWSPTRGSIVLSPDGARALVTFPDAGYGVEIDAADGRLHRVFRGVHGEAGRAGRRPGFAVSAAPADVPAGDVLMYNAPQSDPARTKWR